MTNSAAPNRHIPLQGTPNFRDFGGYLNAEGRQVRSGQLYRSGALHNLTETDLEKLRALNIGTVCDFRHDEERANEPSRWPPSPAPQIVHLPLKGGDHSMTLRRLLGETTGVGANDIVPLMIGINRDFVIHHSDVYAQLLRILVETSAPVLIHCTAGKDRTGFGAAMILAALGVSEEDILHDYLLTGDYLVIDKEVDKIRERFGLTVPLEVIESAFCVRPDYLHGALDAIKAEYGDIPTYLEAGLKFDAADQRELRARLLA